MERIKKLNRYQKGLLVILLAMVPVFAVVYTVVLGRVGFLYQDAILIPGQAEGNTVYSGKIDGIEARFTVTADKTIDFQYGDKTYGPYAIKEDPTAVSESTAAQLRNQPVGIEIRRGEEVYFRGGMTDHGDGIWLYGEDGSLEYSGVSVFIGDKRIDENGNSVGAMEPPPYVLLDLVYSPELTHKGDGRAWFGGFFICLLTAISILFADEFFRYELSFQIRNVESAEPSDWEMAKRYIG